MNFIDAENWVCQSPVDDAIIVTLVVAAAVLGRRAYKAYRESYRPSEEIVDRVMSRPDTSLKLPPHAPRR
jgi:hypothetical protein